MQFTLKSGFWHVLFKKPSTFNAIHSIFFWRSYLYLSLNRQYKGKFLNRLSIIFFLIKEERDFICSNIFRASRCGFRFIIYLLGRIHIESKVNKLTILIWKFLEMNKTCRLNLSEKQMVYNYTWPAATTRHFIGSPFLCVSAICENSILPLSTEDS